MALNHKEDAYIKTFSKQIEEKLESPDSHEPEEDVIDLKSFTFTPRFLTNSKVILTGKPAEINLNDNLPDEIAEAPSKTPSSVKSSTIPKFVKKQTRRLKYRRKVPLSDELKNSDSLYDLTQNASIPSKNSSIEAITSFISEEVYNQIAGLKLSEKFVKKSDFLYPKKSFTCKVALQSESEDQMKAPVLQNVKGNFNKKVKHSRSRLRLNTSYLAKVLTHSEKHHAGLDPSVSILDSKISDLCEILRNIQALKEKELKIKEQELQIKEKPAPIVANEIHTVATSATRRPHLPNILLSATPSKQAFYKWRQRKANLLCYKKSERTFELNRRLINQFLTKVIPLPARNEYCGIGKKCQKAYFIVN